MVDKTQVSYGFALVKYAWHHTDCAPRQAMFRGGRWLGYGVCGFLVVGVVTNVVFVRMLGMTPPQ